MDDPREDFQKKCKETLTDLMMESTTANEFLDKTVYLIVLIIDTINRDDNE